MLIKWIFDLARQQNSVSSIARINLNIIDSLPDEDEKIHELIAEPYIKILCNDVRSFKNIAGTLSCLNLQIIQRSKILL